MRKLIALALCCGLLAACAAPAGTPPLSPREKAYSVGQVYGAVLAAANTAVSTGLLSQDIKLKIAATSNAATKAFDSYADEAAKCFRDPVTGVVGNAPGKVCDQSAVSQALIAAQNASTQASAVLATFGYTPTTGAIPNFSATDIGSK